MLGAGKFGEVRVAQHNQTKEFCAVKIVQRTKLKSKKDVDHINREITFMKMLRHPHVVQLKEALQTSNNIYLFMELVEGGDLIDRVTRDRYLPEKTARKFFQQLIVAVRYFHLQRIAHRDLKLDNLLLDKNDNLKVADLGLANLAEDSDLMLTVVGSPHYVAPEVLRQASNGSSSSSNTSTNTNTNNPQQQQQQQQQAPPSSTAGGVVDFGAAHQHHHLQQPPTPGATNLADKNAQKAQQDAGKFQDGYDGFMADMWSCGVILYTMLSGHYPFDDPERKKLFMLINRGEFRMSSKILPAAANLINKLLVIDPKERYTINDILNDPWFLIDFDQSLLALGSMAPLKAGTPQASSLTPSRANKGLMPSPQQDNIMSVSTNVQTHQQTMAMNGGASSPLVNRLGEATPEANVALTNAINNHNNNISNSGAGAGASAERPHAMFFYLGDVDNCANTMCEVLRRMGALFKNPEQVLSEDEQRQHKQNNSSANDRNLFGYCNPRAGTSLQVFHIAMRGLKKADGSDAHVTSVIVMHRIGQTSDFEAFAQSLFKNLGAKVSRDQPKV